MALSGTEQCTDEQLVWNYQQTGVAEPLEELAQRHVSRVRSVLYAMVLNDADADDLAQEVFIRAFRGLGRFNADAKFATWLYRITLNTARSFLSQQARSPLQSAEKVQDFPGARAHMPDGAVLSAELDREIERALAALSVKLRAALVLTAIHGMPVREAARAEGCATATMYWRIHEARKRVQQHLRAYLEP